VGPYVLHSIAIWLLRQCRRGFEKAAPWILEDSVRAGKGGRLKYNGVWRQLCVFWNVRVALTLRYSPPALGAIRQSVPERAVPFPTSHCFSL